MSSWPYRVITTISVLPNTPNSRTSADASEPLIGAGLAALGEGDRELAALFQGRREAICAGLNAYGDELERFNLRYGLVKVRDRRELDQRHIIDSLAALGSLLPILRGLPEVPQIADVGSGAGLPGIPLAIALPGCCFTLIERMGKRAGFLRNTTAALGLSHVLVEEGEMERGAAGRFNLVCFRAFHPLDRKLLSSLFRLLKPGGVLAAYKGRRDVIDREIAALGGGAAAGTWEILPLRLPFLDEERHLALIRPAMLT